MIALCTGDPTAKIEGEQVIVVIPSGDGTVQIAMTLNQALALWSRIKRATYEALEGDGFAAPKVAEVIPYPNQKGIVRRPR